MSNNPGFSVVVPLYNKADYVVRTLASAFSQLSQPNEIIVVDDGSTDGGAELVESTFPEVRLIRQANSGEASARNVGVFHSQSEWVAFLDADDIWHPNHLLELSFLIAAFPDAHMVSSAYDVSPPRRRRCPQLPKIPRRQKVDILRMTRNNLGAFWTSALAVKRETLEKEGGFTLHGYGADVDTWLKIGVRYPCAYSTKSTATYFTGNPGVMQSQLRFDQERELQGPILKAVTDLPGLVRVLDAADDSTSWVTKSAARRYQNGRVCQALKIAMRNDQPEQAAAFASLFVSPIGVRSSVYLGMARLSPSMRRLLIKLWLKLFR